MLLLWFWNFVLILKALLCWSHKQGWNQFLQYVAYISCWNEFFSLRFIGIFTENSNVRILIENGASVGEEWVKLLLTTAFRIEMSVLNPACSSSSIILCLEFIPFDHWSLRMWSLFFFSSLSWKSFQHETETKSWRS